MGSLVSSASTQDGQKRLVANKPVEVALNEIVTRARVFTDAGGAAIALRDGDYLITRASSGNIAPDVGARNAVEGSLTGQAVLKGVPIHIEDSDKDPRVDADICRQLNTRSFIVTPIAGSTTMLGVLAVFASTPNAFTRTDLAVLRTMADQIATALGGGALMQQLWPSDGAAEVSEPPALPVQQYEPEPVKQAPEPPKSQAPKKVEAPKYEPPKQEPPKYVAPKAEPVRPKPVAAEVKPAEEPELDVLESDPIVMPEKVRPREVVQAKTPAPVVERAKPAPIPRVEPEPVREEIEPIAQPTEQPKVVAKPITAARPIQVKTPAPTPIAKKEPPKPQPPVRARVEDDEATEEFIDARTKSVDTPTGRREKTAVAAKAETAVEERKAVEWRGLSVEQEPESSSRGKIIIGAVALLLVAGGIGGWMMMKKSPEKPATTTSTPAAVAPAPATSSPAATPASTTAPAAATTTTPAAAQPAKPATTTAPAATNATVPAAKPAQPAIVIASGGAPRQNQVEDQAPPQLAFSGGAPQLGGSNAAMPKRAASDPLPAQVIRRVSPTYPEIAKRTKQKGSVELQAEVRKDGTIGKIDVVSGPTLLRQAAIDALKQWRYRPASLSGTPVDSTVNVVISFEAPK